MEPARGNRKVLPNYLLDDYGPIPDSKVASNHGALRASAGAAGTSHGHAETTGGESASDSGTGGPTALLPRRKKKLRQACVYCRRSHLVCEEKRPCHRCVKRGIADRCVDPISEGHAAQDGNWSGTDAKSGATTSKDALVSPPPPADRLNRSSPSVVTTEASRSHGGSKRKRKAKSEATAPSFTWQGHVTENADSRSAYHRPQGAYELTTTHSPHAAGPSLVHAIPSSNSAEHGSTLRHAVPTHLSSNAGLPLPAQSEPAGGSRIASSQTLQDQPIFQPPSSAELDSLFSSYFFDVADSFNGRQSSAQQQPIHPGHSVDAANPMLDAPQQPSFQASAPQRQGDHAHNHVPHLQRLETSQNASSASGVDQRAFDSPSSAMVSQPQHPYRQLGPTHMSGALLGSNPPTGSQGTLHHALGSCAPVPMSGAMEANAGKGQAGPDSKEVNLRQKPGDVYAPYPYRKGYASLMRYMVEQDWSEQSIKSVEAALSKVRRLWFSLEDNIQPSSMIQLQAEWAGNVRYFSESVLPFAPVPMVVCRKAGEVYASNQLAQELCGRSRDQMTGGKISCYELMTESSASHFFRLYERAVGGTQAEDGSFVRLAGNSAPLYWNADITRPNADGSYTILPTRGIFEMKIAPCGLPSLLVCCFVPLT